MTTLSVDRFLVRDDATRSALNTHKGQAHFADGQKRCEKCRFAEKVQRPKGSVRCLKFSELKRGEIGASFPASAWSCKYFAEAS